MQPAPTSAFDVPCWSMAKVHPDHHVQVQKALYSAPTRLIGKTLDVRVRSLVGALVSRPGPGEGAPAEGCGAALDGPEGLPARQGAMGSARCRRGGARRPCSRQPRRRAGRSGCSAGPVPWLKLRQAYGLLRLCERYGQERVNALCARALAFGVLDVPRIEGMLKDARRAEDDGVATGRVIPLPARFARDASAFATRTQPPERSRQGRPVMSARTVSPELVAAFKRLRLGGLLPTLAELITSSVRPRN